MNEQEKPPEDENRDGANIAAIIVVVVLVIGGIWLFNRLNSANEALNCVASGRTNCPSLDNPDAK
jgi:heme/copper-type cytochrome/quinol oxidase subunit 4